MLNKKKLSLLFSVLLIFACSDDSREDFEPIEAEDENFYKDGDYEVLFESGFANSPTMIFIGDAYIKEDLGRTFGKYKKDADAYFEYLFSKEPFKAYKEHFNAVIIYTESETQTIPEWDTNSGESPISDTALRSYTFTGSTGRDFYRSDILAINYYKSLLPSKFQNHTNTLVVLNRIGGGNASFGSDVAYAGRGSVFTMAHEVGHSFALLGDEYELTENGTYDTSERPNLDSTEDFETIKWKHFIGLPGYERTAAFEGGGYTSTGVWRPARESIMRGGSTSESQLFNAPSREAIVKKILEIRGIPYSFEEFLAKDDPSIPSNRLIDNTPHILSCAHIPQ